MLTWNSYTTTYAEYFCIQGLVKVVEEEIEKTEKEKDFRLAEILFK